MANEYQFKYTPLTGPLPGKSMVDQTERAINELAQIVNEGSAQVEVITNLANTANDNSEEALEKANEALETAGRVYITLPNLDDADSYFDSQLYYFANSHSANLPVEDTGFLEVKTNDTKTACEQVFIADLTGLCYFRHGTITSEEVGSETVYSVTWDIWSSELASEDYVQSELLNYLPLSGGTLTGVVNGVTPTAGDDTTKLATTAYVQEEIRQHGNLPVGHEYFSMNPNIPQGSLPLFGGVYSRATYSDLWAWVQTQTGYLKTEAEWQTLSTASNGNVPYYSSGDGSTTFRVPSLRCWVKGANGTVTEVGSYLAAGLPNITGGIGWLTAAGNAESSTTGAFSWETLSNNVMTRGSGSGSDHLLFDASDSNSIYGNSSTVQPPSIVGMWLVKCYGTIEDTGTIDEQQYIDDRMADLKNVYLPANYVQNTVTNISSGITVTNESNITISSIDAYRFGNVVQIVFLGKATSSLPAGSTMTAKFNGLPLPVSRVYSASYLSGTAVVFNVDSSGNATFRVIGGSLGEYDVSYSLVYITND